MSPEALKKCLQKPFIYQQERNGKFGHDLRVGNNN